ncbi:hypothetical protein, partial [Methyloceanibacter marginalis]|uniref:hypothetical protein n=1 Tax=Methyloceanibacter marginalis TaxID=1774971 RepID=UPI00114CEAF7
MLTATLWSRSALSRAASVCQPFALRRVARDSALSVSSRLAVAAADLGRELGDTRLELRDAAGLKSVTLLAELALQALELRLAAGERVTLGLKPGDLAAQRIE